MARTKFAQHGLVRLGYEVQGDSGPVVLMLHGLLADRASLRPLMDRLEDDATVVAMDIRGHGGSSAIHGVDMRVIDLIDDAFAVLDAVEVTQPVIVVGMELGAVIATGMKELHPDRIAGTVLVNYPTPEIIDTETLEEIARLAYREQAEQALNRWLDLSWGEGWKEAVPRPRIAAARRSVGALSPVLTALVAESLPEQESITLSGHVPLETEENVDRVMEKISPLLTSP